MSIQKISFFFTFFAGVSLDDTHLIVKYYYREGKMQNLYSSLDKTYIIQMMLKFRWDTNMYIFWRNIYSNKFKGVKNEKICMR